LTAAGSNIPDGINNAVLLEAVAAAGFGVPVFCFSALVWEAFASAIGRISLINSEILSCFAGLNYAFKLAVESVPVLSSLDFF